MNDHSHNPPAFPRPHSEVKESDDWFIRHHAADGMSLWDLREGALPPLRGSNGPAPNGPRPTPSPAPPLARPSHPATSHAAAKAIGPCVRGLMQWAAQCVNESNGLTQRELGAKYCPDDPRRIGRRLAGAERAGLVKRGVERKCTISGRVAQTYWPRRAQ